MATTTPARPTRKPDDKPAAAQPATTPDKGERLTIPIKDGKIHWDGIRSSRRDELRTMLASSGIEAAAPKPADRTPVINQALTGTLYDLLAQVEALIATRMLGCPVDQAFAALKFTDTEKTALAEPTARVIEKYLPASLLDKYADECMLLLLLTTMTRSKFAALQVTIAAARPKPVTRQPTPIRTPEVNSEDVTSS